MDEKIIDAVLFPILQAILNESKVPNSKCCLHHVTIGNKTLYFNDDDMLVIFSILKSIGIRHELQKKNFFNKN